MATPAEKLARSLEVLSIFQRSSGSAAIRAKDITRTHRERLVKNGFLQEVIKGWYVPSRPDGSEGESTAWYASFWNFCSSYLEERFGELWSLSPEQSLIIHSGNLSVPQQLLVRSPKANNNLTPLPFNTSLFDVRSSIPEKPDRHQKDGLRMFSLSSAFLHSSPAFFINHPTDARTALSLIKDASDVLAALLDGGHTVIAGRLAGAFRNIGQDRIADNILKAMQAAGYNVRENDPFSSNLKLFVTGRDTSPYVNRVKMMWHSMREPIIGRFPEALGLPKDKESFLKNVEENYLTDAYNSLSIEGYMVTAELIERVRSGGWDPDGNDKAHRDALAARGYWQAHQAVLKSLDRILHGQNAGQVVEDDHSEWYRQLFAPSVTLGLLKPRDLAGYRTGQVYIRNSMHVPLNQNAVRDVMPTLFELLREEPSPAVRVVLGHFVFVYIHPYMDGNGRIGRFLMNALLASGGYPWTVIPVERREGYMYALEQASVGQNIIPFTDFLANLVSKTMKGL